jgi:AcrR family transcriptional regulator
MPSTATEPPSRRSVILDAALAEFAARGVAATSIEDIRRRSGASVGSIYHHFGDKDGIAGALYLEGLSRYQRGFTNVLDETSTAREGVERCVRYHLSWIDSRRDLARFLLLARDARVVVAAEKPLRDLNRTFFGHVEGWTRPRIADGELRDLDPELMYALWIGPSQELARHWLAGRSRASLTDSADVLADAAWRSLNPGG